VITNLNLATKPVRNRVLPFAILGLLLLVAGVTTIFSLVVLKQNSDANKELEAKIAADQTEIARLKGEGDKVQQQLTTQQKAILSASHKLVANKSFGWSRLFADLEAVLPGSVSASRISVDNIYNDAGNVRAELELTIISRDYPSVMAMIDNMHNSGRFQAELRGQDLQKNERITYTEYTLYVIYSPGYSYSSTTPVDVAQNGGAQ
jgi:Tfp pilus assembly protein PilN